MTPLLAVARPDNAFLLVTGLIVVCSAGASGTVAAHWNKVSGWGDAPDRQVRFRAFVKRASHQDRRINRYRGAGALLLGVALAARFPLHPYPDDSAFVLLEWLALGLALAACALWVAGLRLMWKFADAFYKQRPAP